MIVSIIVQVMIIVIIGDMGVKWIVKVLKGGGGYMTKKYSTIIKNDYFTHQKRFVSVRIEG